MENKEMAKELNVILENIGDEINGLIEENGYGDMYNTGKIIGMMKVWNVFYRYAKEKGEL